MSYAIVLMIVMNIYVFENSVVKKLNAVENFIIGAR